MNIQNMYQKTISIDSKILIHVASALKHLLYSPGGNHCVVCVLDAYIQKLPESPDDFYLRPLLKTPHSGPRYACAKVGVNTLKKILPDLSKEAGVGVHYTNHSLRATAITRMYEGGVPENLISEKSGHKSIKALRSYESTSIQQEKGAGSMISGEASSGDLSVMPTLPPATIPPSILPNPEFQDPLCLLLKLIGQRCLHSAD